ncbi:hypothetical protein LEP1GSC074_4230 [Leptospira noguchii str. Hook]|uniref:Uncharacterized protein n=1 Tax=Leptospira noguchii serovar Autumnalis str. ZUN142 TaxID=1085540 RepID=M6UEU4_9LEPT|nr:hypothetical protein LEP1GSC041_1867 [Leptospira noguchii str. 2006001870]EMO43040.1 hypothetical protein LEP1GSC186_2414 [Leptospira noguchii serovar Autumnalis str. ZUN142]EMS86002.1 hypothetical protein LEP1GSC074_4230 [Leptospira noguchii str. Hook]EMS88571.1 hypothetical protein LEP1GSC073_3879 [Leptospira noguchii str. Cascata]
MKKNIQKYIHLCGCEMINLRYFYLLNIDFLNSTFLNLLLVCIKIILKSSI